MAGLSRIRLPARPCVRNSATCTRHYGLEGLHYHIRHHVDLAHQFAGWVDQDSRFELLAPVPLNLVCFRHRGGDALNQALLDHLNHSGDLYLSHTRVRDRFALRLCVGQTHTQLRHIERAWQRIQEGAALVSRA